MTRTKISTALILAAAVGAFAAMPANAGTRHVHQTSIAAQDSSDSDPSPSAQKADWVNRSLFYRGPTYIGRY